MNRVRRFFDFYINSSIHVALASTALVYLTFLKLNATGIFNYLLFSFFSTIVGYNFVKYLQASNLYYRQLTRSMKSIRVFTVCCFIGMLYFFLQLSLRLVLLMLPFGVLTVFYAIPFMPSNKNLRSIARSKVFIIAIVWAGVSVVVPVYYIQGFVDFDIWIESLQRFLFVLVLMFPFEIRDLPYDPKTLKTIPQLIGIRKTKILGSLILILFCTLSYLKDDIQDVEIISSIAITVVTLFFLWNSKRNQTNYYCSFWVESIPIMWMFIFMGLTIL